MSDTGSTDNRPRVAVLVLHGVGQQAKFETLASFAAGLAEAAGVSTVRRTPMLIDDTLESAITVSLPDIEVDLIEYYYQPLMQRRVAMADVTRWLVETGFHIRNLYQEYDFKSDMPKGARGSKPKADGDFLKPHYMLYQQGNRIAVGILWILAWLLNALEHLRNVPLTSLLRWPLRHLLGRFIDPVLKEVAGDLILYTAYDPKLALSSARDKVLSGCVERLESLVRCKKGKTLRYEKVFIAGHSLGSVVAYDAVSRISMRTDHALVTGLRNCRTLSQVEIGRIGGLLTFGSPLDKIALMFWPRWKENTIHQSDLARWNQRRIEYRQGLLAHFHGVRGISNSLNLPESVKQPTSGSLANLPWLNVHHPEDLIAGHLDAFEQVTNLQITTEIKSTFAAKRTAEAHSCYWSDRSIYDWLIKQIKFLDF